MTDFDLSAYAFSETSAGHLPSGIQQKEEPHFAQQGLTIPWRRPAREESGSRKL